MLWPIYHCITYIDMSLTNLCSCALMKDNKMRQIINDLYLLFLRIMNLASFFWRKNILIYFFKEFYIVPPLSPPPPPLSRKLGLWYFWFCYQWNCRQKLELEIFKLLLSYITTRILIYECDAVIKIIQWVFIFEAQFQINDLISIIWILEISLVETQNFVFLTFYEIHGFRDENSCYFEGLIIDSPPPPPW